MTLKPVSKSLVPKGISPRQGKFIPATQLTGKEREKMAVRYSRQKRVRGALKRDITKNYTPIFKSADPYFNHEAARKAFDLVMKMDDDEAEMFCQIVATELVEKAIEDNLRTVQGQVDRIIAKRAEKIKKAMVRAAVSDADAAVPFAKALSEISKATPYDYGYVWRESDFRRDPTTGQFRTKVKTTRTKPLKDKEAEFLGLPKSTDKKTQGLTREQLAGYQDQYRQVAQFLSTVTESTPNPGDTDIMLRIKNRNTGEHYVALNNGTRPNKKLWDPTSEDVVGIEARPKTLTVGGAYYGLASSLGTNPSRRQANIAGTLNTVDQEFDSFAADWYKESSDPKAANARTYSRIQSGSQIAGALAPPGSKLQMASKFGEFVGSHGPEAEKVFGPTARKTAYRYRGTEKTPDKTLVEQYGRAVNQSKLAAQSGTKDLAPVQMAAQRIQAERRTPKFEELGAGREVVMHYFNGTPGTPFEGKTRMPNRGLYNLQLASGNTPPSEGVIINRDGQIATQAVGYGDDHYLPFNLKNLKSLKGGEYIRTRSVGGLTSEDIYTGLISGARQVTVISRSGTFTMTFEDDFRGGRRHNDKARRMTKRYEQILDAVQSEQVDRKAVDPEIRAAIQQEVKDEMGHLLDRPELRKEINRRIEEFKQSPELDEQDERLARLIAEQRAQGRQSRDAEDFMGDAMNLIAKEKEFKFRLNGIGYAAALESLREQFPYYITVNSQPRREERVETEMDRGYVEPGRNRPTYAAAGLYGKAKLNPIVAGENGKFSAAEADYQGARPKGPQGAPAEQEKKEESKPGEVKPSQAVKEAIQRRKHADAANKLFTELNKPGVITETTRDEFDFLKKSEGEFAGYVATPDGAKEFDELVKQLERNQSGLSTTLKSALREYKRSSGDVDAKEFEPALALRWSEKPYEFGGKPYQKGADDALVQAEVRAINRRTKSLMYGGNLSSLTEEQMRKEVEALGEAYSVIKENPDLLTETDTAKRSANINALHQAFMPQYDRSAFTAMINHPKAVERVLEDVHRMRALLANGGHDDAARQQHTARVPERVETDDNSVDAMLRKVGRRSAVERRIKELKEFQTGIDDPDSDAYRAINAGQAMLDEIDDGAYISGEEIQSFLTDTEQYVNPDVTDLSAEERRLYGVRPEYFEIRGGKVVRKPRP